MHLCKSLANFGRALLALPLFCAALPAFAEQVTVIHVGDQESWLLSAQGNLRDSSSQSLSFYGGVDRLAAVISRIESEATTAGRSVVKINAGDAFLPGPRLNASFTNLGTAFSGGQDFYDTIALRQIGFDAIVFGNHEFDLGLPIAARFAETSQTPYLSANLNFLATDSGGNFISPELAALRTSGAIGPSTTVTTAGGRTIGIVGVTTPLLPAVSSPATLPLMAAGFSPTNTEAQNLQALIPTVQAEIDALRSAGATVIIVVSHLQNAANERTILVPGLRNVDLVVSGGGHELMADADDVLIPGTPVASITSHPVFANDSLGQATPIVTSNFGNRYVGEVTLDLNDTTGVVESVVSSRMRRVSGATGTADIVTPDATLNANVVVPVRAFVAGLESQIFATSDVALNGERGAASAPRAFPTGVRNSETNLGNLVADSLRWTADTDVALQNGGGVRASLASGNLTIGGSFTVLTFLNLVVRAESVSPAQLKAVLEHGVAAASTSGAIDGRFPQLSGLSVVFDTTRTAGSRVRRAVLTRGTATTADDTVLIDYGVIVNPNARFSFATIDFLANGGDGYPFIANGFVFRNLTTSINYQEAFVNYIQAPVAAGGLGGVVTTANYPIANAFDRFGRNTDAIMGTGVNDRLFGTTGNDVIFGGPGADFINAGAGADLIVYESVRDAGDRIGDFTPGTDRIDLSSIFAAAGVAGQLGTNILLQDINGGVSVQIVLNGRRTPLLTVLGQTAASMNNAANFVL